MERGGRIMGDCTKRWIISLVWLSIPLIMIIKGNFFPMR